MYIAGRNPQKIEEAIEDLRQVTGKTAFALQLDLADLKSIKAAVSNFLECVSIVANLLPSHGTSLDWNSAWTSSSIARG